MSKDQAQQTLERWCESWGPQRRAHDEPREWDDAYGPAWVGAVALGAIVVLLVVGALAA